MNAKKLFLGFIAATLVIVPIATPNAANPTIN